ncbi:hypothetical protein [Metasolibacillus meyeri]|uniref:hypothetical protein n=1 Tax=Metasolibacillus meyeri TaxID=1071052 RepID=UPI00187D2AFF|nr:hypothetical protein [Metasolibacillus meyeri]
MQESSNKRSVEEILHQQLELLAERSANETNTGNLIRLTLAMVEIHKFLGTENKEFI